MRILRIRYNYIDMICADTDMDADEVIKQSEEQDMYNKEDGTYDIEAFMRFLSPFFSLSFLFVCLFVF